MEEDEVTRGRILSLQKRHGVRCSGLHGLHNFGNGLTQQRLSGADGEVPTRLMPGYSKGKKRVQGIRKLRTAVPSMNTQKSVHVEQGREGKPGG